MIKGISKKVYEDFIDYINIDCADTGGYFEDGDLWKDEDGIYYDDEELWDIEKDNFFCKYPEDRK